MKNREKGKKIFLFIQLDEKVSIKIQSYYIKFNMYISISIYNYLYILIKFNLVNINKR